MQRGVTRKWRPPLALVIGGTLAVVLALPLIGIAYFRLAGNILGWGETSWMLGVLGGVVTLLLGFLLWRLVLRPVWTLTDYANALRRGRSDTTAPESFGTPELSELAQAVIGMGSALQGRATQMRAYADHVTHELKSPLTALRGSAELLSTAQDDATRDALMASITSALTRIEQLLDDLQHHARASQPSQGGTTRLAPIATALDIEAPRDAAIDLPRDDLHTILSHLAQNARHHGATTVTAQAGDGWLEVIDDGQGVLDGDKDRIFDPFFTTRRETGGTGMGLSIVRSLLQAHGAEINLIKSHQGATFRITFPQ